MVHPSQQCSSFAVRRPSPVLTLTRHGRQRRIVLRPWLAGALVAVFTLLSAGYIGATAYLVYRDDLLGGTLARQVRTQYEYENRIAALRAELDRMTSRHVVQTQGVEEQLSLLLDRQATIESRHESLDELVSKARDAGIGIAVADARVPRPRPPELAAAIPAPSAVPAPADGAALAYAETAASPADVITGTLIRGSEGGEDIRLSDAIRPLLQTVQTSMDSVQLQQSSALDALAAASTAEAERLSGALAPLGVALPPPVAAAPEGGPFIPADPLPSLHFVERATLLDRTLSDIEALRRSAAALPLRMPLTPRFISSAFGYRQDPFLHRPALHAGIDMVAPEGTRVAATAPGIVASAGWAAGYGLLVEVKHADGVSTRYGHLSAVLVAPGQRIAAGTAIGRVGSTGRSTGPHLHYETRRNGAAVDPAPYLAAGRAL
jgi:murein DD-endopeptidase MepM/ murein hydrolase activator NlpD